MLMHNVAHRDTPICVTNETDLSVGAALADPFFFNSKLPPFVTAQ